MSDIIGRLLDEAEKAQRKGHLVLAKVCRDASDQLGLITNERDAAQREAEQWKADRNRWHKHTREAETERDAARAERDAAIMDADMQAREAGNMEHNARVIMAERDRLLQTLTTARAAVPSHWVIFSDARGFLFGILKEPAHD